MADSPQKVDPEEFQAWKDSRMTQWVLSCLKHQWEQKVEEQKSILFHSPRQLDPTQWASLQASAAFVQGQCDVLDYVAGLKLEDLQSEEAE
jgi:hypothetical protein